MEASNADPKCLEAGFSHAAFDIGTAAPEIRIGPLVAVNVGVVLHAMGDEILKVEPPEVLGGPFRLSALLANQAGTEVLRIDQNEWRTPVSNWDVQVTGPRITVHNAPRDVALVLRSEPPNGLVLERLDMFHKGARLRATEADGFSVVAPSGITFTTQGGRVEGSQIAIQVTAGGVCVGVGGGAVQMTNVSVSGCSAKASSLGSRTTEAQPARRSAPFRRS